MENRINKYALIVAGGSGSRMQNKMPKQFLLLNNEPIIFRTIQQFIEFDSSISVIVVLPRNQIDYFYKLVDKYDFKHSVTIAYGGETRFHSVKNGLDKIDDRGVVFIHDAVRPLVAQETIRNCFATTVVKGNAIPFVPVTDSIRKITPNLSKSVRRNNYVLVQTPQTFQVDVIKEAYRQEYNNEFTDDASVLEKYGKDIFLVDGNTENIKITYPKDILIAETYLKIM